MLDYSSLLPLLDHKRLAPLKELLPGNFRQQFRHGDLAGWLDALQALPDIVSDDYDLKQGVRIGRAEQCTEAQRAQLKDLLMCLHPWRKGPFELFGLHMDTEWRSDWKWDRLLPHISPLRDRTVLDVGCGNGYHCWRMAGEDARLVLGIDSHLLFTMQYWAVRHFLPQPPVFVLPMALEQMPEKMAAFDTVFSMGVLYHRRSPMDHLYALKDCIRRGGELVLETLVIEGETGMSLVPQGRYARMPNVWFLPSCGTLQNWLEKCGFRDVRQVDLNRTSVQEQRSTSWMTFESLPQAIAPDNASLTIEGYPAPLRAIFVARKP